ncbi:hypothetical protein [Amaricoccus macauensis]|uniref:hypothetical protein n=1 Tax=Amaricoccus macauensis TaxID=57001 RepID=UPI003C79F190
MESLAGIWPASVPETLWQFNLLAPESRRDFPFVGIAVTSQFVLAFVAGVILICAFAWKRFSEPTFDVESPAFRDFRELEIWNLKDSHSLRRAYFVYCISLVVIYATLAFFGRVIFQLVEQLNVSGLQLNVGIVQFDSWQWPLFLALGISGIAPLINPLVPVEVWLRRFSHEVVGIPTRLREKADRLKPIIDGNKNQHMEIVTTEWVKAYLGCRLETCFALKQNMAAVLDWSYSEHIQWSDPEIRGKLHEFERRAREEAEAALQEFDYLVNPENVPDSMVSENHQARLKEFEKLFEACIQSLESARDKFSIILAIYCENGSRLMESENEFIKNNISNRLISPLVLPGTGLPIYAFPIVFLLYYFATLLWWHPLISSVPHTTTTVAVTAGMETLKLFVLIWLPIMFVAVISSVVDNSAKAVTNREADRPAWTLLPGTLAAFMIAALTMSLYAILYSALPANNITQMREALLGTPNGEPWYAAIYYYLLFAPVAAICYGFVYAVKAASRRPGQLLARALGVAASLFVFFYIAFLVDQLSYPCFDEGGQKVSIWQLAYGFFGLSPQERQACFTVYSSLDMLVISAAAFISVSGLVSRASRPSRKAQAKKPLRFPSRHPAAICLALCLLVAWAGKVSAQEEPDDARQERDFPVVLGFRTDIPPFSFEAPATGVVASSAAQVSQRPYQGYIADLCYKIFDRSGYDVVQRPVDSGNRFEIMRGELPETAAGLPDDSDNQVDVLCDATTVRLDDAERMKSGIFSPIVFVSGVSYLSRSRRGISADVLLGYVRNSTAKRAAQEACSVDVLRLGGEDARPICRMGSPEDCSLHKQKPRADTETIPPTKTLEAVYGEAPDYVLCERDDHDALIEWFCSDADLDLGNDKVYFGDRDIIVGKLAEWEKKGRSCERVRDSKRSFTYEPYALLISKADVELVGFVQRRIFEIFSHRSGARALFYKWFPEGTTMSEPLAWLFLLNGVADENDVLTGPKRYEKIQGLTEIAGAE